MNKRNSTFELRRRPTSPEMLEGLALKTGHDTCWRRKVRPAVHAWKAASSIPAGMFTLESSHGSAVAALWPGSMVNAAR